MRIVILGLGRVGSQLLSALSGGHVSVVAVDRDQATCEKIAADYSATVICGDFTDPEILDSVKFSRGDQVYAVSGLEEANFLASMYAKQAGAGKVVVKVDTPAHAVLLDKLGLQAFVGEKMIAQHLANQVLLPTIFELLSPGQSNLELFEETIPDKHKDMTVDELNADKDLNVVALYDGKKFILPASGMTLGKGVKLIAISTGKRKAFK
ncbi:MAG: TrkA family potassium uptake protein [Candidatus Micrarchaeota archaeon]|nr:TrkA family potassium uptake protein [Candidatus Micrarchaeota archaeon]